MRTQDRSEPASTVYVHGHHASVLRSHGRRRAADSAAYLLPSLEPGQRLLDVGCGPGTITADLAQRVASGDVVGVDASAEVLEAARSHSAGQDVTNVSFRQADVYALPFDDGVFDVVHAHQVLQHLGDPVAALREIRRVTRPGGVVAVRDSDYGGMTWFPRVPGLDTWNDLYHRITAAEHAEADAGRRLLSWVLAAGFDADGVHAGGSAWCWTGAADREWWAGMWAERATQSSFAERALAHGLADPADLETIADAWRAWGQAPDAWFLVPHGEVLARA